MFGNKSIGKLLRQSSVALLAALAFATPARAANVLYYVDLNHFDYVTPAITATGNTVTTATSWTDFNTKLAAGPGTYQLAIGLNQNAGGAPQADLVAMTNYIAAGGHFIWADWTRTASYGALFNGTYPGGTNQTPLNFTNPALSAGIVNPQPLTNPGWGTFSMDLTAAAGGTSMCTNPDATSCLVSGNSGRTLLLGFLADTPSAADGVRLWQNLIGVAGFGSLSTPVPTLSQWALIALALLLAGFALLKLRRRG